MIRAAPKLRVVGRAGAGIDNIDLHACASHGVRVVHTPEANIDAVVEFVLSQTLPILRSVPRVELAVNSNQWDLMRSMSACPTQLNEMTIGILGFGRVGSKLGQLARGLGFRVMFHDIKKIVDTNGCEPVDVATMLQESHVVSIHVDGRTENKNLVDGQFLAAMKPSAVFVNTSRGFIVDAQALANHLRHDPQATAILDVHDPEPFPDTYPLLGLANAYLYPHIAAKTQTAMINMGWVVKDVDAVLRGEEPKFETSVKVSI